MLGRLAARLIDERLVLTIITLHMVTLFIGAFPRLDPDLRSAVWLVEYACAVYFIVEIVLKVRKLGWRGFWSVGLNRFDFIIVVASLPTLVTAFSEVDNLNALLILRAARLLRLFRILRFIPHTEQLWDGIGRALKASVGILLLLLIYNVVLALMACHLFREAAPDAFADPLISLYSMFKVFTVEGWFELPDQIARNTDSEMMGAFARIFFIFAVLTGGIMGLSMANAVLVDEMVLDNNADLEREVEALRAEVATMRAEQTALLRQIAAHVSTGRPIEPDGSPPD